MREATGGALLINIIITFIIIFMALIATSLNYSKAFKVKDNIVGIIEDNKGYNDTAKNQISAYLKNAGYPIVNGINCVCKAKNSATCTSMYNESNGYQYCVYKYSETNKVYYQVVAYMYFDIPVISNLAKIPVYGETKSFKIN